MVVRQHDSARSTSTLTACELRALQPALCRVSVKRRLSFPSALTSIAQEDKKGHLWIRVGELVPLPVDVDDEEAHLQTVLALAQQKRRSC